MENPYQNPKNAQKYLSFLASKDGLQQKEFLYKTILPYLPQEKNRSILDAACGNGWLTEKIYNLGFTDLKACDSSEFLLAEAKKKLSNINFEKADIEKLLPYPENYFSLIILNMAVIDMANPGDVLKNLSRVLKPGGKLLLTLPHPDYTYPKAEWRRNFWQILKGQKPRLVFKKIKSNMPAQREFLPGEKIASFSYSLEQYKKSAYSAGLVFEEQKNIISEKDSRDFDLQYRLFRYPLLLLLVFEKPSQ